MTLPNFGLMEINQAQMQYWAVRCTCGNFISLSPIYFDPESGESLKVPSQPDLFEATCEAGHLGRFTKGEVISWLGPPMIAGFQIHPAFHLPHPPAIDEDF